MSKNYTIFLTGATGTMGIQCLRQLAALSDRPEIIILVRDSVKNRMLLKDYISEKRITIRWGDLTNYSDVLSCVRDADIVLHVAALVSPAADYNPHEAMRINYGSTQNILNAIHELNQNNRTRFVYIGTVAETGERLPPIHWGRVGDPIKPSMFDYYAVSKVAAERLVIESGLKYWVSLRQTGIIGPAMSRIWDAIMLHNCFDTALEYVSDRDSGRLLVNLCLAEFSHELDPEFWGHIYNIGGGPSCRIDTYHLYQNVYSRMGIADLNTVLNPKWQATRNFHGQFYLDSDKPEHFFSFRHDSLEYFYDCCTAQFGTAAALSRILGHFPGGSRLTGSILRSKFRKLALTEHGTLYYLNHNMEDHIEAFWGSKTNWNKLPLHLNDVKLFNGWDKVVSIDHGYDESKPESLLDLSDVKEAAHFRGGRCLSNEMIPGDWNRKLLFSCAFGHTFEASPRLILEGGHWCPVCERTGWNYGERAERDPYFAQVWYPLHKKTEKREYPKIVSEQDI